MVVLKNITKKDPSDKENILDSLNFHLRKQEYVEIIYNDDIARDTLLMILAAIDCNFEGEYLFNSIDIKSLDNEGIKQFRIKNIGLVIRELNLISELTVEENLELPFIYQKNGVKTPHPSIGDVLQKFNLTHKRQHYPKNLSPYLKLKTSIAQTYLSKPQIIIIEYNPTMMSADDHLELTSLLYNLNEEGLSILSLLPREPSFSLAHRKLYLNNGRIA